MLNHWVGMGRLVRDPEMRKTGSGISVANFTIAVDRDFKGQNGEKETDYIDCVAWRGTADTVCKYFTKGRLIVVVGSFQSRKWNDKSGNKRTSWECQVNNVYFADSKKDAGGSPPPSTDYGGYSAPAPDSYSNRPADFNYPYPGQSMPEFAMLEGDDEALPF